MPKLTESQVKEIRALMGQKTHQQIADLYGVARSYVTNILNGKAQKGNPRPPNPKNGNGAAYNWLLDHVSHQGDECLTWPFALNHGYGHFGYLGKLHYAHRFMCELIHGAPPAGYQACHSCGNGHLGCVNPRHLSWKTRSENRREGVKHNRIPKTYRYKLNAEQVAQIRALEGKVGTLALAKMFDTSPGNIRHIMKRTSWPNVSPAQHSAP